MVAINEGVKNTTVSFYSDDSDTVNFLVLNSCDLRPNILRVQNLDWLNGWKCSRDSGQQKPLCRRRVTRDLRNGGPRKMPSIAKLIKIKVLLHQFSNYIFNLHYM